MKLKNVHDFDDKIIGAESEQMFTIDTDNHVIFDILRSKMYSDPIAAICREVASNSRDANRESGKGEIPITIRIIKPNEILFVSDMSISFEDNGPGISPSRMGDVFLKYGASTKRDTDAQTGGFGLGAKTPFAYSDTFTIITVCDIPVAATEIRGNLEMIRRKYIYTAMIDSSGKGKMVLMDSQDIASEKENTGTRIIVPINENDRDRFERECISATRFWDVLPKLVGFYNNSVTVKRVMSIDEEDNSWCVVYDDMDVSENWFALIDGIAYPISNSQIVVSRLETNHRVLLVFDNGELTISANREQLQFDEETVTIINNRLTKITNHFQSLTQSYIENANTFIEACIRAKTLSGGINKYHNNFSKLLKELTDEELLIRSMFLWLHKTTETTPIKRVWRGLDLVSKIQIPNICVEIVTSFLGKTQYDKIDAISSYWETYPIIYKDIKNKDNKRNATLFKDHEKFILISQTDVNINEKQSEKQMDFIFNWGINFINYSDIQKDETVSLDDTYKYTKQPVVDVDCFISEKGRFLDTKHSIEYSRKAKEFTDPSFIWVSVNSLNQQKVYEKHSTINRMNVISYLLNKTVVMVNERSATAYLTKSTAMKLDDAMELIKNSPVYQKRLQDIANISQATDVLSRVDYNVFLGLGVEHESLPELRRIVEENAKIAELYLKVEIFNVNPNLSISPSEITYFYDKWRKDNPVFSKALHSIRNIKKTITLLSSTIKDKDSYYIGDVIVLKELREMYMTMNLIKKQGPNNRIATLRIKQGLKIRPVKKRYVNLAK